MPAADWGTGIAPTQELTSIDGPHHSSGTAWGSSSSSSSIYRCVQGSEFRGLAAKAAHLQSTGSSSM